MAPLSTLNQRYEIVRTLGSGGMGEVLLVRDTLEEGSPLLALKRLTLSGEANAEFLEWFKREFQTLTMLRHPGLARVYEFDRERETNQPFYTSEFIDGLDLYAATRALPLEATVAILLRTTQAIDFIHTKGILHNDLKTGNILVEKSSQQPKILDFGLSFLLDRQTKGGASAKEKPAVLRGTASYTAPELIRGAAPSIQSDLYAFGMVLYKVLAGKLPHTSKESRKILQQNLEGKFPPPSKVNPALSPALSQLVLALLDPDPRQRPAAASEVLNQLALAGGSRSESALHEPTALWSESVGLVGRQRAVRLLKTYVQERIPSLSHTESTELLEEISQSDSLNLEPQLSQLGQPGFAALIGATGLGKSALLTQLKIHYQLHEVPFFLVQGKTTAPVFAPWKRLLAHVRSLFSEPSAKASGQAEALAEYDALLDSLLSEKAKDFPEVERAGFFFALGELLARAFTLKPFVLAVDDAAQLDEVSRDLLKHLERLLTLSQGVRLPPILLSFRTSQEMQTLLKSLPSAQATLEALSRDECASFLKQVFVGAKIPEALLTAVYHRSGGNPFFIQQLLHEIMSSTAVRRTSGAWQIPQKGLEALKLPPTLEELLGKRFAGLSPTQKRVLALAAIYEEPLREEAISGLLERRIEELHADLRFLVTEDILREDEGYAYSQAAFADLVRRQLAPDEARGLHRLSAQRLEKVKPKPYEKLARHYAAAGQPDLAAERALQAGNEAQALFALERSRDLYLLAIEQARLSSDGSALELGARFKLAEVYWRQGQRGLAVESYEAFLESGDPARLSEERAQAFRQCGLAARRKGQFKEALAYFEKGHAEQGQRNAEMRALFAAEIALVHEKMGQTQNLLKWKEQAMALVSRKTKPAPAAIPALLILAEMAKNAELIDESIGLNEKILAVAEQANDARNIATALNNLGLLAGRQGKYEAALVFLQRALTICRKTNDAVRTCHCLNFLGRIEYLDARFRDAAAHLLEGLELATVMEDVLLRQGMLTILGQIETDRGNYSLALRHLEEARKVSVGAPAKGMMPIQQALGNLFLIVGKIQEAREIARRGLEQAANSTQAMSFLQLACQGAIRAQDFHGAEQFLKLLEERAKTLESSGDVAEFGSIIQWLRGQVLCHSGKVSEAREVLRGLDAARERLQPLFRGEVELLLLQVFFAQERTGSRSYAALRTRALALTKDLAAMERPELLWQAYGLLSEVEEESGSIREAIEATRRGAEVLEGLSADLDAETKRVYLTDPTKEILLARLERLSQRSEFVNVEMRNIQELNKHLFRLLTINRQLAAGWQNRGRLLDLILDTSLEVSGGRRSFVLLREKDTQWTVAAWRGQGDAKEDPAQAWSRSIANDVAHTGRAKVLLDAGKDKDHYQNRSVLKWQVRTVICVPLALSGRLLGVLYIDFEQVEEKVSRSLLDLLRALSDQAALSMVQAEHHQQLVQSLEETSTELRRAHAVVQRQTKSLEWKYSYSKIIGGKDPPMRAVFELLDRVIPTHSAVLIHGESGTGKELIAQAIHYNGPRKDKPFVSINCAGLNPTLLESELFGHVRGAFTGAENAREGLFLLADEGTVFLDEIADMPLEVQAKLLRTLQEGEIRPLGSDKVHHVNVRVISASNQPLAQAVEEGRFRRDFFYRLNVVQIDLPPLRARQQDLDLLIDAFLLNFAKQRKIRIPLLSSAARHALHAYRWPGNVRELYNTIESVVALLRHRTIDLPDLPETVRESAAKVEKITVDLEAAREEFTRDYLKKLFIQCGGSVSKIAATAGIHRQSMYRTLERYGILGKKR